jgi:hypothetical protein
MIKLSAAAVLVWELSTRRLGRWVAKDTRNGEAKELELNMSERAELRRLRKEIQQVKMDFLK